MTFVYHIIRNHSCILNLWFNIFSKTIDLTAETEPETPVLDENQAIEEIGKVIKNNSKSFTS